ncbi:TIGR01906 family membrane protein [Arthrobacter sp. H41]|uniref:TIGR01906 family membrane protein n=1 Tax=Arthrobacter sp. H41 TaxID=1312978 RepID=UPI0004B2A287|nr:TIGR01906 family membrane protein [Arthrobacter sp. H41]
MADTDNAPGQQDTAGDARPVPRQTDTVAHDDAAPGTDAREPATRQTDTVAHDDAAPRTAALPTESLSTEAPPAGAPAPAGATPAPVPAVPLSAESGSRRASADDTRRYAEPPSDTGALTLRPSDDEVARRTAQREQAVAPKPGLPRFLQVLIAVLFPVIVLAGAVRAVTTSSFLWIEYHRPGFPADSYGFSTEDRMTYGSYALDYVINLAPARYLGGLVAPGGGQLFLDSEVGHMEDVKAVLQLSFGVAFMLFLVAVASGIYLARKYKGGVRRALFSGAVITLVLIVALAVAAILAWQTFFTQVHALFFADGSWTFRVDDTLIRLFPEQFWTDAAASVGAIVLLATLLTLVLTWPTRTRRERSRTAQEAQQARYAAGLEPRVR